MIKDPVYLLNPSLRPSTQPEWIGPYSIVRRTLYGPYTLRDDTGNVYHRRVPIDQMKILYSPKFVPAHRQQEEQHTYEVEYIMDHRDNRGAYEYKVKWKGYGIKDATWEKEDSFDDPATIERYFKLLSAKQQAKRARANRISTCDYDNVVITFKQKKRTQAAVDITCIQLTSLAFS